MNGSLVRNRVGFMYTLVFLIACGMPVAHAQSSHEHLAQQAVKSISESLPKNIRNLAILKIEDETGAVKLGSIIDELELALVNQAKNVTYIDRKALERCLKEIRFSHEAIVNPATRKKVGKAAGVHAFLYGRVLDSSSAHVKKFGKRDFYTRAVFKLVGVESSSIVWAKKLIGYNSDNLKRPPPEPEDLYDKFAQQIAAGLDRKLADADRPKVVDFWYLTDDPPGAFMSSRFYDALTLAIANSKKCRAVDRRRLEALFKEQELVTKGIVDKKEMKRVADIWSIDSFLFGKIIDASNASLKGIMKATHVESGGAIFWMNRVRAKVKDEKTLAELVAEQVAAQQGATK